jgi:hypothetical protein
MSTKPASITALSIACPVCKASPGSPCVNGGALPFNKTTTRWAHQTREHASRKRGGN